MPLISRSGLFCGKFEVHTDGGRIALWNYELTESQMRRWLRDLGIKNTDAAVVLNLRGYRLPLVHDVFRDWAVRWLRAHNVTAWIVDPFARAFVGCGDENSNTDVGRFLDILDQIKTEAGVRLLVLPTHTGHSAEEGRERPRGASRLADWADSIWVLSKDEEGRRYLSASGRDVEIEEEMLTYRESDRTFSFGGGDRIWMRRRDLVGKVVAAVYAQPGIGAHELRTVVGGTAKKIDAARQEAIATRRIRAEEGTHGKILLYPPGH